MDTVWIKLNITVEGRIKQECFMFGPTGIVRFRTESTGTKLFNSATTLVAEVREDSEYIMDVLGKMRGTKGRLHGKEVLTKEEKSSRAPQKRQTKG